MNITNEEVARVAIDAPRSAADAVAGYFDVNHRTAYRLITQARNAGYPIPIPRRGPKPGTNFQYDQAAVASVAIRAFGHGPMTLAVAEHFQVSRRNASALISRSRKAGHPIPRDLYCWTPAPYSVNPREFTPKESKAINTSELACACGWSCSIDGGGQRLAHHTLTEHGRRPSQVERTPRKIRKVAA